MKQKGFTLVEILVVMSVLSVVGVIILTIFTRILKGNNKAQILSAIKQNGQAVLENMDKTVRGADKVNCPISGLGKTLMIEKDGVYTRYRFEGGLIKQDHPVPAGSEIANRTLFINSKCDPTISMLTNAVVLTDRDPQKGVFVKTGSFESDLAAGFKASVKIKFELDNGAGAPEAIAGQIDPVSFETTVQLR